MESPFSPVPSRGFDSLAALALKRVRQSQGLVAECHGELGTPSLTCMCSGSVKSL